MADERRPPTSAARMGLSRRGFLATAGLGAVGLAAARPGDSKAVLADPVGADERVELALRVNGRHRRLIVEPRRTLLAALRDDLGLTGAKAGCERGECGACTVLVDGLPRYACLTLALEVEGREVTTVEGLMEGEELGPVQAAFVEHDAFQCGFCTPGQVMAAEGLLRARPDPTIDEIRTGLSGNLCRCGAHPHIFKAVRRAAERKKGG